MNVPFLTRLFYLATLDVEASSQLSPDSLDHGQEMEEPSMVTEVDPRDSALNLTADDIIQVIERHPSKSEILSKLVKRYVALTVNGEVKKIIKS